MFRKTLSLFFLILTLKGTLAQTAAARVPRTVDLPAAPSETARVPRTLDFAGVTITFDESARQIIQADVNALMSNRRVLDSRLERIVQYFPMIEGIFAEEQIPTDFKYLVVQESGLVPDAVSTSNAVGFWQFKKETAGDFGLRVDNQVDERKNIHSSTHAAAQYLKRNNVSLNNWISTLYSYYLGLGGIQKLVPPDWAGSAKITVNDQTDRYILRCMAHKIVFEQELLNYKSNTFSFYEYHYANGKTFSQIAAELQVDEAELRRHNRWVGSSSVPADKEYVMLVPVASSDQMTAVRTKAVVKPTPVPTSAPATTSAPIRAVSKKVPLGKDPLSDVKFPILKRITPPNTDKSVPVFYEINGKKGVLAQEGDTPEKLAIRADIWLSKLLRYNDLTVQDRVVVGEVYYLEKKERKAVIPYYTAQRNETLRQVSQTFGMRVKFLLKYNRLKDIEKLQPGRVLWLQKRRPSREPVEIVPLPEVPINQPVPVQPTTVPIARTTSPQTLPSTSPMGSSQPVAAPPTQVVAVPAPGTGSDRNVDIVIPSGTTRTQTTVPPTGGRVVLVPDNGSIAPVTTPTTPPARTSTASESVASAPKAPARATTQPQKQPVRGVDTEVEVTLTKPNTAPATQPKETVPASTPQSAKTITHTVKQGDTFYSVARKYGITVDYLRELNGFKANPQLKIGDRLAVTPSEKTLASEPTSEPASPKAVVAVASPAPVQKPVTEVASSPKPVPSASKNQTEHVVKQGDTFYSIARTYGISVDQLRSLNGLSSNPQISVGDRFVVSGSAKEAPKANPAPVKATTSSAPIVALTDYEVQPGETFMAITRKFNVSPEQLRDWNGFTEFPKLKARQIIKVKKN